MFVWPRSKNCSPWSVVVGRADSRFGRLMREPVIVIAEASAAAGFDSFAWVAAITCAGWVEFVVCSSAGGGVCAAAVAAAVEVVCA